MARGHRQGIRCLGRGSRIADADDPGRMLDFLIGDDRDGTLLDELRGSDLVQNLLPELAATDGFDQRSPWHPEGDLYTHTASVYRRVCLLSDDPDMRWVAILHDLGKPDSFWIDEAGVGHFYASPAHGTEAHEVIGERMAHGITARMGLDDARRDAIALRVRWHMSRPETTRGLARLRRRVGDAALRDLLLFRLADHEGDGDPAAYVARMHELALVAAE